MSRPDYKKLYPQNGVLESARKGHKGLKFVYIAKEQDENGVLKYSNGSERCYLKAGFWLQNGKFQFCFPWDEGKGGAQHLRTIELPDFDDPSFDKMKIIDTIWTICAEIDGIIKVFSDRYSKAKQKYETLAG